MSKCFADDCTYGMTCKILNTKECEDCNFFKTQEQVDKENERTRERLKSLKNKSINIFK